MISQGHRSPLITTSARRLHGYDIMVSAAVVKKTTITLTITIRAILTASVISPGARDSVARSDATFGHCQTCTVQMESYGETESPDDGWRATMAMGSVAKQVRSRIMIIMEQLHETDSLPTIVALTIMSRSCQFQVRIVGELRWPGALWQNR